MLWPWNWFREILWSLESLRRGQEEIMGRLEEFNAILARIDTATTDIATKINDLLAQIAAGGLTDAEEQTVIAQITEQTERLEGIAHDPADPVPEV